MKIIDTHCHLNDEALYKDLDNVISRALSSGVEKMIVIGWDKDSSELAIKIAEQYEFIYAVIGFHPENVFDIDDDILYKTLNLYKQNAYIVSKIFFNGKIKKSIVKLYAIINY